MRNYGYVLLGPKLGPKWAKHTWPKMGQKDPFLQRLLEHHMACHRWLRMDYKAYIKDQKSDFWSFGRNLMLFGIFQLFFSQTLGFLLEQDHPIPSLGKYLFSWITILYAWKSMYIMLVVLGNSGHGIWCFCMRCVIHEVQAWTMTCAFDERAWYG